MEEVGKEEERDGPCERRDLHPLLSSSPREGDATGDQTCYGRDRPTDTGEGVGKTYTEWGTAENGNLRGRRLSPPQKNLSKESPVLFRSEEGTIGELELYKPLTLDDGKVMRKETRFHPLRSCGKRVRSKRSFVVGDPGHLKTFLSGCRGYRERTRDTPRKTSLFRLLRRSRRSQDEPLPR